jgi:uncharacterized protein
MLLYDILMTNAERLRRWLLETTQMMVDHPDDIKVELAETVDLFELRLVSHPSDVGKLIGKQGRTARSLRTIGSAIAMTMGSRLTLDIVERDAKPL